MIQEASGVVELAQGGEFHVSALVQASVHDGRTLFTFAGEQVGGSPTGVPAEPAPALSDAERVALLEAQIAALNSRLGIATVDSPLTPAAVSEVDPANGTQAVGTTETAVPVAGSTEAPVQAVPPVVAPLPAGPEQVAPPQAPPSS